MPRSVIGGAGNILRVPSKRSPRSSMVIVAGGDSFDADASAFFTATGITDATQKDAINDLVIALKADGIWSKMSAVYPFVGGTAGTHKFNLKDPADTDAAFRLTFVGGWTHSATGGLPNGTTGYADTHFNQSTDGLEDDESIGIYNGTNTAGTIEDIGVSTVTNQGTHIVARRGDNVSIYRSQENSVSGLPSNSDSRGLFMISRTGPTTVLWAKNGTVTSSSNASNVVLANHNHYIGAGNNAGTAHRFSNREIRFAFIGVGMIQTEMEDLYAAIQAFQTALSRNV